MSLGFRGIWKSFEGREEEITQKMHHLKASAEADIAALPKLKGTALDSAKVVFLSDTIVISVVAAHDVAAVRDANSIWYACYRAGAVLAAALNVPPHLAYRGCVAFGAFEIEGPFLLGPAIDEAATYYEHADGAFVWLTPNAKATLEHRPHREGLIPIARYPVPLKGGSTFETWVVSPFQGGDTSEKRRDTSNRLLATFDKDLRRPLDIQVKLQHTQGFLDDVMQRQDRTMSSRGR